jgi:hypothetical protein
MLPAGVQEPDSESMFGCFLTSKSVEVHRVVRTEWEKHENYVP